MTTTPDTSAPRAGLATRAGSAAGGYAVSWLRIMLVLLGVLLILFALLTLVFRLSLPLAAAYKTDIEAGLGDYLKRPVSIDDLSVRWRHFGPELKATGLQVVEETGQRVFIDNALLDVDLLSSLIRRTLVIDELTLVGADLAIERRANGSFVMHGITSSASGTPAASPKNDRGLDAVAWLFNARRVGLLNTQIRIINYADDSEGSSIVLDPVDLRAENVDGEHRLRVSAKLPEGLGQSVEFAIDLTSTPARIMDGGAHGRFQIVSNDLDIARVLDFVQSGLIGKAHESLATVRKSIDIGSGALAMNLTGILENGRVAQADGNVSITGLASTSGAALADAVTTKLQLRSNSVELWHLDADGLTASRGEELLRADTLRVFGGVSGLTVEAAGSDGSLALATSLARLLPSVDSSSWLEAADPQGLIAGWRTLVKLGDQQPNVDVVMSVPELQFDSALGAPGMSSIAMSLIVDDNRGHIEARSLSGGPVVLTWPNMYSNPLELNGLSTIMSVAPHESGIRVEGPLTVASASAAAGLRAQIDLQPGQSPYLEVDGDFALDDVTDVPGFLPDEFVGETTTAWFRSALTSGAATDGRMRFEGHVDDFPFEDGDGQFTASMLAHDVAVRWNPAWPTIRSLNGTVNFDGVSFSALANRGRVASMGISQASVSIADLRTPHLLLNATGSDQVSALIAFANDGPLSATLRPAFEEVSGIGRASMDLQVVAPLSDRAAKTGPPLAVDGSIFLRDNTVSFAPAELEFASVTGAVDFDLNGVSARRLKARWLNRLISVSANMRGTGEQTSLIISMSGVLEGSDVLSHYGLPLDRFVRGASSWVANLDIPFDAQRQAEQGFRLVARSDLTGSELQFPAPFFKSSSVARPLSLVTTIYPDEPVSRWTIRQAGHATAVADVDDGELVSLAIGLGDESPRAIGAPGIRIDGGVNVLDVDGWVESISELISDLPDDEPDTGARAPILPVSGSIRANRAVLRSMPLGQMRLQLSSDAQFLNAVVENRYVRGSARYPRYHEIGETTPMTIRLARVGDRVVKALLGEAEPESTQEDDEGGLDPRELPPIEARVASLQWEQLELEGLTLRTEPDIAGLNIQALGFSHDNLTLIGTGYWRLKDPQGVTIDRADDHETRLSLALQSGNFGRGLDDIGLDQLISAGAGRFRADVTWNGPAWSPSLDVLNGSMAIDLQRGRVRAIEPGAGRLIGLFAFQALPQRLSLDFTDVTGDGLAFSSLAGEATITDGVVNANLIRLEGPIGVVDVSGKTDLNTQQFDQRVTVLPRVSAALPVIGAISGGAGAGIGVLIAGGLLKALGVDLDRIGLREYRVHGDWEDPRIDPWRNKSGSAPVGR